MRNIREVLRLHFVAGLSIRQIHRSTKISVGAVQSLLKRAKELDISWPVDHLDDAQLAQRFYPNADTRTSTRFQVPDWAEVKQQLAHKGVTKQLLWEEYCQQYPNRCYSYSQYCDRYLTWLKKQKRSMRQHHKAGEVLFVDYAGKTMPIVDGHTGEIRQAQIFVAAMGASNYYYSEATWSQSLQDWLESHVRAFEFIGGVPQTVVPDNLRSGVSKACKYDPDVNPSYQQLAQHYGTVILPTRPRKPKDKAKVEVGVQIIERWILARLRHQSFFSLGELNQCIQALLTEVNQKPFKQLEGNRREWFEKIDRPALLPLPRNAYEYTHIKRVKVNIDYHVEFDHRLYSVPHELVGETIELQATGKQIRLFFQNHCVATHIRGYTYGFTTDAQHMPKAHFAQHKVSPGSLKNQANAIGPAVLEWVTHQLTTKAHPEQAYRVCIGALGLTRQYSAERLNRACKRANHHKVYRLKQLKNILTSNLDQLPEEAMEQPTLPQSHENIRGPHSFH